MENFDRCIIHSSVHAFGLTVSVSPEMIELGEFVPTIVFSAKAIKVVRTTLGVDEAMLLSVSTG